MQKQCVCTVSHPIWSGYEENAQTEFVSIDTCRSLPVDALRNMLFQELKRQYDGYGNGEGFWGNRNEITRNFHRVRMLVRVGKQKGKTEDEKKTQILAWCLLGPVRLGACHIELFGSITEACGYGRALVEKLKEHLREEYENLDLNRLGVIPYVKPDSHSMVNGSVAFWAKVLKLN